MDSLSPNSPDNNPQKQCTGLCGRVLPATPEFFHRERERLKSRCKECIKNDKHKESEYLREKQREREERKEQEAQSADSYVYGILKKERLIYVGRGKTDRVYESLRDHHGTSYFFFAQEMTYSASVDLENALLTALKEKLENGAGARNRNRARNKTLLWFEEKGYLEETGV